MASRSLITLYDFENKQAIFPDVHRSFKFCTLVFGGAAVNVPAGDFVFFARNMDHLAEPDRHIPLSGDDLLLLNPNTRTCPIFRSKRDAELTKAVYRRVPILVDEPAGERGNPWGIRFFTMFHQTNDAELFHTREQLQELGFIHKGNRWTRKKQAHLPLYEAKMVQAYDHRAASVVIDPENWMRQGQTAETSLTSHQDPDFVVQPRWWVAEAEVVRSLGDRHEYGFIGFKDITSPTNERTMIAAAIPWSAVTNHFPLILTTQTPRRTACLLANLNSFVLDYVARQKIGGVTLNFFLVKQFAILPPAAYDQRCPWSKRQSLGTWISDRVLKLTCTSNDMRPFAEACGMAPPVHKWLPDERAELLAELDAAFFILYGISRADADYILSTFTGTQRRDESDVGYFRTAKLVLATIDAM